MSLSVCESVSLSVCLSPTQLYSNVFLRGAWIFDLVYPTVYHSGSSTVALRYIWEKNCITISIQNLGGNPFFASDLISSHSVSPFVAIENFKSQLSEQDSFRKGSDLDFDCRCYCGVYFWWKWSCGVEKWLSLSPFHHISLSPLVKHWRFWSVFPR